MKESDLKKVIKRMVKESLNEILMENYIKSTVKEAINANLSSAKPKQNLNEVFQPKQPTKEEILREQKELEEKRKLRSEALNKVFFNGNAKQDDPYKQIFEDTLQSMEQDPYASSDGSEEVIPGDMGEGVPLSMINKFVNKR